GDRPRRAAEHALGLDADGVDLAGARVDRDDRRLGEHDATPPYIDEGVGGAEVYGHVTATETGEIREKAHEEGARAARAAEPPRALSVSKGPGAEMARKRAFRPWKAGCGDGRAAARPRSGSRRRSARP